MPTQQQPKKSKNGKSNVTTTSQKPKPKKKDTAHISFADFIDGNIPIPSKETLSLDFAKKIDFTILPRASIHGDHQHVHTFEEFTDYEKSIFAEEDSLKAKVNCDFKLPFAVHKKSTQDIFYTNVQNELCPQTNPMEWKHLVSDALNSNFKSLMSPVHGPVHQFNCTVENPNPLCDVNNNDNNDEIKNHGEEEPCLPNYLQRNRTAKVWDWITSKEPLSAQLFNDLQKRNRHLCREEVKSQHIHNMSESMALDAFVGKVLRNSVTPVKTENPMRKTRTTHNREESRPQNDYRCTEPKEVKGILKSKRAMSGSESESDMSCVAWANSSPELSSSASNEVDFNLESSNDEEQVEKKDNNKNFVVRGHENEMDDLSKKLHIFFSQVRLLQN